MASNDQATIFLRSARFSSLHNRFRLGPSETVGEPIPEVTKMKENITNRPDAEDALDAELIEEQINTAPPDGLKDAKVDTSPLPKGMREKVETVEVSTLTPKG